MSKLDIVRIPALSDNYIWLIHDPDSAETMVVDPAEAGGVERVLAQRGWSLTAIWNTHWHPDHTGGNAALKEHWNVPVIAPAAEAAKIPTADRLVAEGDTVMLGAHAATVLETPAHTAGHVTYHFADDGVVFTGDTLFAMGCGRLFEGTAAQMYANLQRLAALPPETSVYCAHEYTLSNARFAHAAEPGNKATADRLREVEGMRDRGEATVPTTIALERATNPFMRAQSIEQFAERRASKDAFRG